MRFPAFVNLSCCVICELNKFANLIHLIMIIILGCRRKASHTMVKKYFTQECCLLQHMHKVENTSENV